jgi:hypothetical protein
MVEIVTTGAALVGASSWFLNKVLGPSAEELGARLRIYAAARLDKILYRAEQKAASEGLQINAVPPAFAIKFYQESSLSDDDDILTEMWANLLLEASSNFSYRHRLYVSILAQIGREEAKFLDSIVSSKYYDDLSLYLRPFNATGLLREAVFRDWCYPSPDEGTALTTYQEIVGQSLPYPGAVLAAEWGFYDQQHVFKRFSAGGVRDQIAIDILTRQGLVEHFHFTKTTRTSIPSAMIEGVLATSLGVEFVLTCRGFGLQNTKDA